MKPLLLTVLSFIITLFPGGIKADTFNVIIYTGGNPPYTIIENGEISGIFKDLFAELETYTGHKFKLTPLPVARALKEFDFGGVDIEPGVNEKWRQHTQVKGLYSIPYEVSTEVLVFKPENRIQAQKPEDLYGKSIGIVRGYSYPRFDPAFSQGLIKKVENISEHNLLQQMVIDRLRHVFIGYRTILYYQKKNPQYRSFQIGDIVSQVEVKLRVHPNKSHLLPELNRALATMLEQGKIKAIYDKYR